jgi:hypothetical protein
LFFTENGVADRYLIGSPAGSSDLVFRSNSYNFSTGSEKMRLDASGNLGLGVTPSAWNTVQPAFQIGYTAFSAYQNTQAIYSSNAVYTSGWKYLSNTNATYYSQNEAAAGTHAWFIAPSGTAGNAITFTQAMTLDASGRLGIGTTSPSAKLEINAASSSAILRVLGGGDGIGGGKGNIRSGDQGGTNYFDFGRDNLSTGNFVLTSGGGSPLLSITTSGAATFSSSVTATDLRLTNLTSVTDLRTDADGDLFNGSDFNLKNNITQSAFGLNEIMLLNPR